MSDDTGRERQSQERSILVDHDAEISVERVHTTSEHEGKTVSGFVIFNDGERTWLSDEQTEAMIEMLSVLRHE